MRVVVDSSVWIDHLRASDPALCGLLSDGRVLMHPYVRGEIALGTIKNRASILEQLARIGAAPIAATSEVEQLIESVPLVGRGVGYVDAHLLASVLIASGSRLLTHDRRLAVIASELGVAYS